MKLANVYQLILAYSEGGYRLTPKKKQHNNRSHMQGGLLP
jgi:hypothetical protein